MNKKDLEKRIAYLEFENDQLQAEINYIDNLLKTIGFPDGLCSLKRVAEEIITEGITQGEEC